MADDDRDRRDDDRGFSLSLPPITLPEVRLPRLVRAFPLSDPPEKVARPRRVRTSRVLLVVALADLADAAVVVSVGPAAFPWVRAAAGTLLSTVLVGLPGLLYAWELFAVLGGVGWATLAPTATLLVVARALAGRN